MVFVVYLRPSGQLTTTELYINNILPRGTWKSSPISATLGLNLQIAVQNRSTQSVTSEPLSNDNSLNTTANRFFTNLENTSSHNWPHALTIEPLYGDVVIAREDVGDLPSEIVDLMNQHISQSLERLRRVQTDIVEEMGKRFSREAVSASFKNMKEKMFELGFERFTLIPNPFDQTSNQESPSDRLWACDGCGISSLYMLKCPSCGERGYCGVMCGQRAWEAHGERCAFMTAEEREKEMMEAVGQFLVGEGAETAIVVEGQDGNMEGVVVRASAEKAKEGLTEQGKENATEVRRNNSVVVAERDSASSSQPKESGAMILAEKHPDLDRAFAYFWPQMDM